MGRSMGEMISDYNLLNNHITFNMKYLRTNKHRLKQARKIGAKIDIVRFIEGEKIRVHKLKKFLDKMYE